MVKTNNKSLSYCLAIALILLLFSPTASAFPQIAAEYYGDIFIHGKEAKEGTIIDAYDSDGNKCGSFTVRIPGKYGTLSCSGDDLSTTEDEGANNGDEIIFLIDNTLLTSEGNTSWGEGEYRQVNLYQGNPPLKVENPDDLRTKNSNILSSILIITIIIVLIVLFSLVYTEPRKEENS